MAKATSKPKSKPSLKPTVSSKPTRISAAKASSRANANPVTKRPNSVPHAINAATNPLATNRPSYGSFAAIPPDVRERLSNARESSRTLSELLAIDFAAYLRAIEPRLSLDGAHAVQNAGGIIKKLIEASRVVCEEIGDAAIQTFAQHPTDLARGIAAYMMGHSAMQQADLRQSKLGLSQSKSGLSHARHAIDRVLHDVWALADDAHSGVREWAWMGIRPVLALDIKHTIRTFDPWIHHQSPNIRRFASEATRPRGVWCTHIALLRTDPSLGLPLLEPLRADTTKYVQDSVSNWLNDASKDDAIFVRGVAQRWTEQADAIDTAGDTSKAKSLRRVVTRALRTVGE